jgi:hypothetical protein
MSMDTALDIAREELWTFSSFSRPNVNLASVSSLPGYAYFDLSGGEGFLSDYLTGNDDIVAVRLQRVGGVQAGITLGDHQLQGIRLWHAEPVDAGTFRITTEAFEQPRWLDVLGYSLPTLNVAGAWFARDDMRAIWDTHLTNIADRRFGGGGVLSYEERGWGGAPPAVNPWIGYFLDEK